MIETGECYFDLLKKNNPSSQQPVSQAELNNRTAQNIKSLDK